MGRVAYEVKRSPNYKSKQANHLLFLRRGGNRSTRGKTSRIREENQLIQFIDYLTISLARLALGDPDDFPASMGDGLAGEELRDISIEITRSFRQRVCALTTGSPTF